ncbi:MAG: hypothetical protein ACLS2V_12830 [Clostridium paraputrificum]|uniref:hypothetical protein n=1 Tax=Clostridium sp. TaxID=1506 RepID=UPI0025C11594|nr:hypothetical protein [Clostridium sp.]MBS5926245.1 hypothetical protein [Clostridium sp.]
MEINIVEEAKNLSKLDHYLVNLDAKLIMLKRECDFDKIKELKKYINDISVSTKILKNTLDRIEIIKYKIKNDKISLEINAKDRIKYEGKNFKITKVYISKYVEATTSKDYINIDKKLYLCLDFDGATKLIQYEVI